MTQNGLNLICGRRQIVIANEIKSDPGIVSCRVPQGSFIVVDIILDYDTGTYNDCKHQKGKQATARTTTQQNHATILLYIREIKTAAKKALLNQCTRKGYCYKVQKHLVTMLHQKRLQNKSKNQSQKRHQNLGSGDDPECPGQQLST